MDVGLRMLPWKQSFSHILLVSKFFIYLLTFIILTNDSLTIAHLNIEPICANTSDVTIFTESLVFYS